MKNPYTTLSNNIYTVPENKGYTITSLPKGMTIAKDGSFVVTENIPVVVVIDRFVTYEKDPRRLYTQISPSFGLIHGEVVTRYAVHGLEDKVGVLAIDCDSVTHVRGKRVWIEALNALIEMQKQYHNIVALNLSMSVNLLLNPICEKFHMSKHDLKTQKEKLLDLMKCEENSFYDSIHDQVMLFNELVDLGVEMYIGTGNSKDGSFNAYNLSKAHAVSDNDGDYDNELMATCSADGTHSFRKKFDWERKQFYVTDGNIRIYRDDVERPWAFHLADIIFALYALFGLVIMFCGVIPFVASFLFGSIIILFPGFNIYKPRKIRGTSFATPMKLNEDLKARMNAQRQ